MKQNKQFDIGCLPTFEITKLEEEILNYLIAKGTTVTEISKLTGINIRTLYRKFQLYKINYIKDLNKMITVLERAGYEIIKK
jgi:hypothetical protein